MLILKIHLTQLQVLTEHHARDEYTRFQHKSNGTMTCRRDVQRGEPFHPNRKDAAASHALYSREYAGAAQSSSGDRQPWLQRWSSLPASSRRPTRPGPSVRLRRARVAEAASQGAVAAAGPEMRCVPARRPPGSRWQASLTRHSSWSLKFLVTRRSLACCASRRKNPCCA